MVRSSDFLMRGLLHAYYWTDESLQNLLQAEGWPTLPRTQSMIMVNVADGCTRPSELARRLGITRQAIQQTIAEMESMGLVQLSSDPGDARAKIVEFSPKGASIQRAALRAIRALDAELERRLGKREFDILKRVLLEKDWGPVMDKPEARAAVVRRKGGTRASR